MWLLHEFYWDVCFQITFIFLAPEGSLKADSLGATWSLSLSLSQSINQTYNNHKSDILTWRNSVVEVL